MTGSDRDRIQGARKIAERAMSLLTTCHKSYVEAEAAVRRNWNRALFKAVYVAEGQIKRFEYAEPFPGLLLWASSNKDHLVSRPRHYLNQRNPKTRSGSLLDFLITHYDELHRLADLVSGDTPTDGEKEN